MVRRNVQIACSLQPRLSLAPWREDSRNLGSLVPADIVRKAVQRAEEELLSRQQLEYRLWAASKEIRFHNVLPLRERVLRFL